MKIPLSCMAASMLLPALCYCLLLLAMIPVNAAFVGVGVLHQHSYWRTATKLGMSTTSIPSTIIEATAASPNDNDDWIRQLDYEAFGKDVTALGKEIASLNANESSQHLQKMVNWRNAAAILGVSTMWMPVNIVTVAALSTWTYASWTMIAHHTCHGGYNRVDAAGFNSRGFALGNVVQRGKDWLDWMLPEAWNLEHNRLHHYRLNEITDPDLVQRNMISIRQDKEMSLTSKYAAVAALALMWKWWYYAPNTFKELQVARWKKQGNALPDNFDSTESVTVLSFFRDTAQDRALRQVVGQWDFFIKVLAPFLVSRFMLLPLPLLAVPNVGPALLGHALANLLAAELLTNMHAFLTIVTNHASEDLYSFDDAVKPKSSAFYVRQIVGSANYQMGSDAIDFCHGFLNYQIEHHVWPDLSMRQYQVAAPRLRAICQKHGVPYVQESVWERLRKTVDVMVGNTSMRPFPTHLEPSNDKATNGVKWKKDDGAIDDEGFDD